MSLSFIPQAYAACNSGSSTLSLEECYTLSDGRTVSSVFAKPSDMVNLLVSNIFVVAGIILFFTIMYAGFLFIQGGSKGKDQARQVITTALIGFIIMFIAYWIVKLVGIITGMGSIGI